MQKNLISAIVKNSSVYTFLNKKIDGIDVFSTSEIVNFLLSIIVFFEKKVQLFKKATDKIINFCLKNPAKKIVLLVFFMILINPFTRHNVFGNISGIFLSGIFLIFLINTVNALENNNGNNKSFIAHILVTAFLLKIIYLLAISQFTLFSDEYLSYHDFARRLAHAWLLNTPAGIPAFDYTQIYYNFLAGVYYIFGAHFFIGRLINLFIHILTGYIIYLLAKNTLGIKSATASVILFFLSFSIHLMSTALLREGFLLFLTSLVFLFFILALKSLNKSAYIPTLVYIVLASYFTKQTYSVRSYFESVIIFSTIITTGIYFIKTCLIKHEHRLFNRILIFSIFIIIIGSQFSQLKDKANAIQIKFQDKSDMLQNYRNELDYGHSRFYENLDISSAQKMIKYLPIGLSYAVFSPFPTKISDKKTMIFFLAENILWYTLFPFIIIGSIFALKEQPILSIPLLLHPMLLLIITALLEGNVGNLLRHAIHFKAFFLIFAAHGIAKTCPDGFLKLFRSQNINK